MHDDAAARLDLLEAAARRRLAELTGTFADLVSAARDANVDDEHDPEGATIAFERSQVDALVRAARDQLSEVDAARARIAAGTYGRCERCGEQVDPGRLEARPLARTCMACAGQTSGDRSTR